MWDSGDAVAEGSIVHLVDEDTEESSGLFVQIRLELGVDLDDEGRSDGREQTSLRHKSVLTCVWVMCKTYKYERHVKSLLVFLHEFPVIFICLLTIMFIEFGMKILLR